MKTPYDVMLKPVISEKSMEDAQSKEIHIQSCCRC